MSKKYKTILLIIFIFIAIVALLGIGYFIHEYNQNKNSAEVVIDEELSINYLTGSSISFNNKKNIINFSVINDGDESSLFSITLENIEIESSRVTYDLYDSKKEIQAKQKLDKNGSKIINDLVEIKANTTKSYKLVINNPEKKKVNFKIKVVKTQNEENTFAKLILNNNNINKESKTKVGEEVAIIDEGLIQDIDDLGNTFYFRGNVKNNYVNFANRIWRIVKINGDGTVKLILDNIIDNRSIVYDANASISLDNFKNIKNNRTYDVLNSWYETNLKSYDEYIHSSKFCIDTTKEGEQLNNYLRINVNNTPTFNCLGTKNNSKIGLLTIDEIIYAGASLNEQNDYYYLYNPNILVNWWTNSPAKGAVEGIYYYEITTDSKIVFSSTGESSKALRPVINLNKDLKMVGKGTIDDPYKME